VGFQPVFIKAAAINLQAVNLQAVKLEGVRRPFDMTVV